MVITLASVGTVLALVIVATAPVLRWRAAAPPARLRRKGHRILFLGVTPLTERIVKEIRVRPSARVAVVGAVDDRAAAASPSLDCPIVGPFRRFAEVVAALRPDRIVVALAERRGRTPMRALLDSCVPRGVIVEDAAEFYERITGKLAIESLTPNSIVFSKGFRPSRLQRAFARGLSLTVALTGLVLLSPLLAMIPLAIKLDSRGPALFVQERAGRHRRPFKLFKFRTMHVTAAPRSEWAGDNGDRVTRVGKWLRALRLDELPQFINIVRGEMNLVGPRPHPVSNLDLFTLVARNLNELTGIAIGYYELRSVVRPGLTGWAQVRYGYANNLEEEIEKLRFDLYYVKHASPWLDLRVLIETVRVMFCGRLPDGSAKKTKTASRTVIAMPSRARATVRVPAAAGRSRLRSGGLAGSARIGTAMKLDG
jgi:exopolysaccharide biosynthesis polyprenyl glycosylphosphotransferase